MEITKSKIKFWATTTSSTASYVLKGNNSVRIGRLEVATQEEEGEEGFEYGGWCHAGRFINYINCRFMKAWLYFFSRIDFRVMTKLQVLSSIVLLFAIGVAYGIADSHKINTGFVGQTTTNKYGRLAS